MAQAQDSAILLLTQQTQTFLTQPLTQMEFYLVAATQSMVAILPERGAIECYAEGKPSAPWCVVVRGGPGKLEITIDGYGAQLGRPLVTQVARLGEYRRF